jgi:hypothetical protein
MLIINDKTMYIHIPKTSGTNLRYVFAESANNVVDYDEVGKEKILSTPAKDLFWKGRDISDLKSHPFLNLQEIDYSATKHAPLWVWQQTGDWNNHKVITIVRNPYTRAVSLYKEILRLFGNTVNQEMTFDEFLNSPAIQYTVDRFPHSHKTQQVDYLKDLNGDVKIDKFYKIESDMAGFARAYKLRGLNSKKHNSANYDRDYSKIYDDFLIDWVRTTYADDFEAFGYSTEPFWLTSS